MTAERDARYFEQVASVPVGGRLVLRMTDWVVAPPENIPPGTNGDALFRLQQCLAYVGELHPSHVTGQWDDETDAALRRFQKSASLKEDAWYGQGSRTAMRLALGEEAAELISDDEHDEIVAAACYDVPPEQTPAPPAPVTSTTTAPPAPGNYLFRDAFEVVDPKAYLRDAAKKSTGKLIAVGTRVYVVAADRTYVQIATAPGAAETIKASDNVWTAFGNLGGTGAVVPLGNEKSDAADKTAADAIRASLPTGRASKSPFKWKFSTYFQPSLDGKDLESTLMAKVYRLMQWAIQNDMVTGDIVIGDGVRSPKRAHQMCVAWEIQYGSRVKFDAVKALPGGKDKDGNLWYKTGWSWEDVKANANKVRASKAIAAAGWEFGDARRAPLPLSSRPGVSLHCTGRAVDVTIPWRKKGVAASQNKTDVWGWENVYNLFGLHRPLGPTSSNPENWHIQETGKKLATDAA